MKLNGRKGSSSDDFNLSEVFGARVHHQRRNKGENARCPHGLQAGGGSSLVRTGGEEQEAAGRE
jgi:hypothetical protein